MHNQSGSEEIEQNVAKVAKCFGYKVCRLHAGHAEPPTSKKRNGLPGKSGFRPT
jgi:hypothetical protein